MEGAIGGSAASAGRRIAHRRSAIARTPSPKMSNWECGMFVAYNSRFSVPEDTGIIKAEGRIVAAPEITTLGGGCFWCLEAVFDDLQGVLSVESGYMGGSVPDPSYEQVCT